VPEGGPTLFGPLPGFLLRVVFALLGGLVVGWCVAFLQSARVVSYALLRKQLDQADPSEIFAGADRLPPAPATTESAGDPGAPPTET